MRIDAGDPAARDLVAGCDAVLHFAGVPDPAGARRDPAASRARERRHHAQPARGLRRARRRARSTPRACARRRTRRPIPTRCPSASARTPAASTRRAPRSCASRRCSAPARSTWEGATGAIAAFAARALEGEPIVIPGDPRRTRDFVYVDDMVGGLGKIVREGRWNQTLTLGSGVDTPLIDVAELVRDTVGSDIRDRDPGRGSRARRERELRHRRRADLRNPAPRDRGTALCRLASPPSRCSRPRPSLTRSPTASPAAPWRGLELCLMPPHVADDAALRRAIEVTGEAIGGRDVVLTAEAPVSWPSGAFVRVDRLDDEAAAASSAAPSSPPGSARRCSRSTSSPRCRRPSTAPTPTARTSARSSASCASTRDACLDRGVTPLIENVPPVLRMRTGGVYLSPVGGHWRDLLEWRARGSRSSASRSTPRTPRCSATSRQAYPSLFGLDSDDELELERYVEELGPATRGRARLGRPRPARRGPPLRQRRAGGARPGGAADRRARALHRGRDQRARPGALAGMKAGYREVERALALPPAGPAARPPRRLRKDTFDWQRGARPPRPGARRARAAGAVRRPARADHGRRRLDRRARSPRCSSASARRRSRCSTATRRR